MPLSVCTISGTIYDVQGAVAPNVAVYVQQVIRSGVLIASEPTVVDTSDAAGLVSFTVPRDSVAYIGGNFTIGGTEFVALDGRVGVKFSPLTIPDAATATLESLGAAATIPVQGLTIKSNGTALANLCGTVDFSSDFTVTESPTGEANVSLAAAGGGSSWGAITGTLSAQTDLQSALDLKAALASPALTGIPTAPTAAQGTNTTQLSTTAFVRAEIAALVGTVPSTLDTLDELAQALGDDPNFATTMTTALGLKANTSSLAAVALSGSAADLIGSLADARLSANVPLLSAGNTFAALNAFNGRATISVGQTTSAVTDLLINPTTKASGNLIDAQVNGSSKFAVTQGGNLSLAQGIVVSNASVISWQGGYIFGGATTGANTGTMRIVPNTGNAALNFGGDTSSFPALKRSTTGLIACLADASADTFFQASEFRVATVKVLGAQGAAVADATDAGSAITQLNLLLARCRSHGLIAS